MTQDDLPKSPFGSQQEYERKLQGRRGVFWLMFSILIAILVMIVSFISWRTGGPKLENDQPLKGAPQFIVLSLVVVFAAYLRQVSGGAIEQRTKILGGDVWNYPPDRGYEYVADKIDALNGTVYALSLAAPFMIALAIVSAGRIALDGAGKFGVLWGRIPWFLYHVDLAIGVWLFLTFCALAVVHWRARGEDERIQILARQEEPRIFEDDRKQLTIQQESRPETREHAALRPTNASTFVGGGTTIAIIAALLLLALARKRDA